MDAAEKDRRRAELTDELHKLNGLVGTPGWDVFLKYAERDAEALLGAMRSAKDDTQLLAFTREYMWLLNLKEKPKKLLNVLNVQLKQLTT